MKPSFERRFRFPIRAWVPALLTLAAVLLGGSRLAAQDPPIPEVPEEELEEDRAQSLHALGRPTAMFPVLGPPGTRVELKASLLPALTPMQVALGGTRYGFEALILTLTDAAGNLEVTVEIPDWTANSRSHRFIIFNAYFTSVHAVTPLFHVTDSEGKLRREGEVTWTGPGCVTLTTTDDEFYDLVGSLEGLEVGNRVAVAGWIVDAPEVTRRMEENCPRKGYILQVAEVEKRDDEN